MLAAPSSPAPAAFYARTDAELPSPANPSVHLKATSEQGVIRAREGYYEIETIHAEGYSLIQGSKECGLSGAWRHKIKKKIGQLIAVGWGWLSSLL